MGLPDNGLIGRAVRFAAAAHEGAFRADGVTPYITHPIAVATILHAIGEPAETVAAAVLHDVIEDCGVDKEYLSHKFGIKVALLVSEVTFPAGMPDRRAAILAAIPGMSPGAVRIKLVDALVNLSDLANSGWDAAKVERYKAHLLRVVEAGYKAIVNG
jgi:(p)ppGpp synthase/HD superfamily hydrolase